MTRPLLTLATLLLLAGSARAEPIVLTDPPGDDHGPGTYRYPGGPLLVEGALDLVEVVLTEDGDTTVVEARFQRRIRVEKNVRLAEDETRTVFAQQVDIYIDQDGVPGSGSTATIPGRRLRLPAESAWERAIVLTPVPERVARAVDGVTTLGVVLTPLDVRVSGNKLSARIPTAQLGGSPSRTWGYAVAVSSATFSSSVATLLDSDSAAALNVYTRDVTPAVGTCGSWRESFDGSPCTFGECAPCGGHPRVMDVLVPPGGSALPALNRYSESEPAVLPVVYPAGRPERTAAEPAETPQTAPGATLPVIDTDGDLLTARVTQLSAVKGVEPGRIVDILDGHGTPTGKAVVVKVLDGVLVLRTVVSVVSTKGAEGEEAQAVRSVRIR